MKKINENKASIAFVLFAVTLVFAIDVHSLLAFFLLMLVSGTSLLIGALLWDRPARAVRLFDPVTGEEGIGYPLRWLLRDLALRFWHYIKVPLGVAAIGVGLTFLIVICLYNVGLFDMSVIF